MSLKVLSCSSDSSSLSNSKGLGCIPGESMWDLQWAKWHCGKFLLQYFSFLCQSSAHQCYYTLITVLIIRGLEQYNPFESAFLKDLFVTRQSFPYHYWKHSVQTQKHFSGHVLKNLHYFLQDVRFPTHTSRDK
jgi:hypothetical protein